MFNKIQKQGSKLYIQRKNIRPFNPKISVHILKKYHMIVLDNDVKLMEQSRDITDLEEKGKNEKKKRRKRRRRNLSHWITLFFNVSPYCRIIFHYLLPYRVFANGPGDLGSIPGRVIPKTQKMVLDVSLLNTQHYKVRIKGKVEQSREGVAPSPTPWCSSYRKGSLRVTLDYGRQLYFYYIYYKNEQFLM